MENLLKISIICQILSDRELRRLSLSFQLCEDLRSDLVKLDGSLPSSASSDPFEANLSFNYSLWAMQKRVSINVDLAEKMAELVEQREKAKRAFGRAQVSNKIFRGKCR